MLKDFWDINRCFLSKSDNCEAFQHKIRSRSKHIIKVPSEGPKKFTGNASSLGGRVDGKAKVSLSL